MTVLTKWTLGVMLAFLLTGCADMTEVQDRAFVMALGVSLKADEYVLTFALPDIGESDDEPADGELTRTYSSVSLKEIEDLYNDGSNKQLDYRHLVALVLDEKLGASPDKLAGLFAYIEDEYRFSRDVRVFFYPGNVKELLESRNKTGGLGGYLKALEDNLRRKNGLASVTAGNLTDCVSQGKWLVVPTLALEGDTLGIDGAALFGDVLLRRLTKNEAQVYHVLRGQGRALSFHAEDGPVFKLNRFSTKTRYAYENGRPLVSFSVTGVCDAQNGDAAVVSAYLEQAILTQLETAYYADNTDYLNLYDGSGMRNRWIWQQYADRREDFAGEVMFEVSVDVGADA